MVTETAPIVWSGFDLEGEDPSARGIFRTLPLERLIATKHASPGGYGFASSLEATLKVPKQ